MVIIGGNFTAMFLASLLAEKGVSICLLSKRSTFATDISLRETGQVQLGLGDNPFRLCAAIGEEDTKEILQFSQMGINILKSMSCVSTHGGLHIAKDPREVEEVIHSAQILQNLGFPCNHFTADEISAKLQTKGLLDGWFSPQEITVDLQALAQQLTASIKHLHLVTNCNVLELVDTPNAVTINTNLGALQTHTVVYCGDYADVCHHGFFAEKLYPVRSQCIGVPVENPLPYGCVAQYGYIYWRDFGNIRMIGGCRWATPHLEVGETDDTVTVRKVDVHLQKFARDSFGVESQPRYKWSGIRTHSCDGLPIIGSLPGRPDIIACCGFNGHQLPLGISSAKVVFDLLIHGKTSHLPKKFDSYRFL